MIKAHFFEAKYARNVRAISSAVPSNLIKIQNILVPLPPLAEQKRIVEKVEQLMGLCDELESKLRKEREDSEKLMETVVRRVC